MSKLIGIIVVLAIAAGITWHVAGREPGPRIEITSPRAVIGRSGELSVAIDAPHGKLSSLDVVIEQGSTRIPVFSSRGRGAARAAGPSAAPGAAGTSATSAGASAGRGAAAGAGASSQGLIREGHGRLVLTQVIGKAQLPQLTEGKAKIVVTASRPVLFGYRHAESTVARTVSVQLMPPIISVVSTGHYITQGGSEMVVYRVSPANVQSGVEVGPDRYPGYPAAGAHVDTKDPGLRVAFFALLWDQDPHTPISLYARDSAGNVAHATFEYEVIPKTYPKSTLAVSDRFLERVVPPILANDPSFKVPDPSNLVDSFVRVDHDLAIKDDAELAALARETSPVMLWSGPWVQQRNSAVEAKFAEQRTFTHDGKVIGHEVHFGYDLASVAGAPVTAENSGRVVFAGWLDIYGNAVVIDHGMGVQSLYGHMSSLEVRVGQAVRKGEEIGREGETGLAGGPHVHFSMLVGGHFVTPLDWWSRKWIHDRVMRKLEAVGTVAPGASAVEASR